MFEVIGYICLSFFIIFLLVVQYHVVTLKSFKKGTSFIDRICGFTPLLPFVVVIFMFFFFILKNVFKSLNKWFEINLGWFFVNGRKRSEWAKHLREKYK